MSDLTVSLLLLFGAPVVLGALFWLIAVLEPGSEDPGCTPFDPPQWWW